jgi:glucokinase
MYSIGIDIGGMSIKTGLVKDGVIIEQNRVKTAKTPKECIIDMVGQINTLLKNNGVSVEQLNGIGIGCPGAVSRETGMVEFLPNLGWEKVPLVEELKNHFDVDVVLSNDANVAALAETMYGCAKDYNTSVMFTLGTGVGGGIVIDNKLFEGGWSRGAELGHATLFLDGEQCTCGRTGCIECYTSATALMKQTREAMLADKNSLMWDYVGGDIEKVDGRTAFECEKKGDKAAKTVVDNYVKYLGESILNMLNIFRPEAFILGGGVSAQGKNLTDRLEAYCEKFDYGYRNAPKTKILIATLGNDAGIIGAAALVE